ncbi:ORF6N domain-containing protein [Arachidicoccus terrestris]|uniref:ORF6N domain-containing protein n=1 Tax=Arachidicoccus terrestris TaxID=2875539 RepID=UPI001CC65BDF|nr:ORF6N domain-containing protein [Arachidicoccus terrestris]UAY57127.1 ORF6N domain-containing protein [Arachidicoccus terrestris]
MSNSNSFYLKGSLQSQFVMSNNDKMGLRRAPYAFTEQGVAMLSAVLRSEVAVRISVQIMNTFVQMRKLIGQSTIQQLRFNNIESKLIEHDQKFNQLFTALEQSALPQKGIFYDGEVFDAYNFVSDVIRKAKKSIILIDNYVDDSLLTFFTKRKTQVGCFIYTKKINKSLRLDVDKHNAQYPPIELREFTESHDRFLIIDRKELYHIGASLKDLGKKWFAFSRMDSLCDEVLDKLKGGKNE